MEVKLLYQITKLRFQLQEKDWNHPISASAKVENPQLVLALTKSLSSKHHQERKLISQVEVGETAWEISTQSPLAIDANRL